MFEYDTVNRWVFRRLRKVSSDGADVTSGGRLFQTWGPATGKALSPTVDRLDCGWMRWLVLAERRARRLGKSATRTNGPRYDGAQPCRTLYVSTAVLNWMRCGMRSQCRLISASDTWSERRKPKCRCRCPRGSYMGRVWSLKFKGCKFYRGLKFGLLHWLCLWALTQCSATALPVIRVQSTFCVLFSSVCDSR